jgi:hypothetical protein
MRGRVFEGTPHKKNTAKLTSASTATMDPGIPECCRSKLSYTKRL